jgi:hypothetical protein
MLSIGGINSVNSRKGIFSSPKFAALQAFIEIVRRAAVVAHSPE